MNKKVIEILEIAARISVVFFVISMILSIEQRDLIYIAVGISLAGICYFTYPTTVFITFLQRDESVLQKSSSFIFITLFSSLGLLVFFYGVSLFLHHYDYDWLFNIYCKKAKELSALIEEYL